MRPTTASCRVLAHTAHTRSAKKYLPPPPSWPNRFPARTQVRAFFSNATAFAPPARSQT